MDSRATFEGRKRSAATAALRADDGADGAVPLTTKRPSAAAAAASPSRAAPRDALLAKMRALYEEVEALRALANNSGAGPATAATETPRNRRAVVVWESSDESEERDESEEHEERTERDEREEECEEGVSGGECAEEREESEGEGEESEGKGEDGSEERAAADDAADDDADQENEDDLEVGDDHTRRHQQPLALMPPAAPAPVAARPVIDEALYAECYDEAITQLVAEGTIETGVGGEPNLKTKRAKGLVAARANRLYDLKISMAEAYKQAAAKMAAQLAKKKKEARNKVVQQRELVAVGNAHVSVVRDSKGSYTVQLSYEKYRVLMRAYQVVYGVESESAVVRKWMEDNAHDLSHITQAMMDKEGVKAMLTKPYKLSASDRKSLKEAFACVE